AFSALSSNVRRLTMSYAALSSAGLPRRGVSKAVYVYDDLPAAIIGLALKPGTRIAKTEICGRLHVSRQPLAEAIARLAEHRLVRRRAAEVVEAARAELERTRRLLLPPPGRNQNTLREHRAIFAALSARDPKKAAAAMGDHLDEVMEELKRFAGGQPELFEP